MIFLAPTERGEHVRVIRAAGGEGGLGDVKVSLLPEGKGCDVLWSARGKWYGVQRKAIPDLLASVHDGRLTKELAQMEQLGTRPWVVVEGRWQPAGDGMMVGNRVITSGQFYKMLQTISDRGVTVARTDTGAQTGEFVVAMYQHSQTEAHKTATSRPKATGNWGAATSRDWGVHLLQGFDGIGPKVAAAIYDKYGVPFRWTVTVEELMTVEGVGRERATKLLNALKG